MYAYTILAFYLLSSKQVRLSTKKLAWSDTIDFDKSNFIDFITCFPSAHKLIFFNNFSNYVGLFQSLLYFFHNGQVNKVILYYQILYFEWILWGLKNFHQSTCYALQDVSFHWHHSQENMTVPR